jgi:hypothetical protein
MYHNESPHAGRPHFHATYGDYEASFEIESLELIVGNLPPRARRLVVKWAEMHRGELRDNWNRARKHMPLQRIDPLP